MTVDTILENIDNWLKRGWGEEDIKNKLILDFGMPENVWENVKKVAEQKGIKIGGEGLLRGKDDDEDNIEDILRKERREYFRRYRATHKEKIAEINKRWNDSHKKEKAAINKRWYEKNRDILLPKFRRYYLEHRKKWTKEA